MQQFIAGQRWISNAEAELGLGIVVEVAARRVLITFPAATEQRTYVIENAPLSRVVFGEGDQLKAADGRKGVVKSIDEEEGRCIYSVEDAGGKPFTLDELDLDSFMKFSKPQDRLFAGQVDKLARFNLRVDTLKQQFKLLQSKNYGLAGPRVQLLPHQLYIASQVGQRHAPRVLLADEVGLGKTIEAGLVIHQQVTIGFAQRVLIVVPDSLIYQWLVEMRRRFNLLFSIVDQALLQSLAEEAADDELDIFDEEELTAENPFETSQLVICPLSLIAKNDNAQQQVLAAHWDIVVVDEAHHLEWTPTATSVEYDVVEQLAVKNAGLLLLTATPEQLGMEGHYARLRLLDPQRYYDLAKFIQEEQDYQPVSELATALIKVDPLQSTALPEDVQQQVAGYLGEEVLSELQDGLAGEEPEEALQEALDSLLDRHGTGRVLFRNTRDNVQGFPDRQLCRHPLEKPGFYPEDFYPAEVCSIDAVSIELLELLQPERLLPATSWLSVDPRVQWLVDWLKANRQQKTLIICAQASTAIALEQFLRIREGVQCAAFHEGMGLVERDRAAAYFADEDESAQALVCSEIGSEGRNFQFASQLVLFDLPLNPDLLEQRIGRLDRIGQRNQIAIHVPYYEETAQQQLLEWFHRGLNAFESVCPSGATVFAKFHDRLISCLGDTDIDGDFSSLVDETAALTVELEQAMQQGRSPLLEMNSCHPVRAAEVVEDIAASARPLALADYMEKVFDHLGVDIEPHSSDAVIIKPGDHMTVDAIPGLPEDGLTATYLRAKALSREDMQFFTWEHPVVTGTMEILLNGDFGNTALGTIKLPPLKPGTLLLEGIFVLHCPAPSQLRLQRYLKQPMVRILMDNAGNDLSQVLPFDKFSSVLKGVPRNSRTEIVKQAKPQIDQLIGQLDAKASESLEEIIEHSLESMRHELHLEHQRLESLSAVNPNIRREEISYLEEARALMESYLLGAQLKLDAIRVVVAV